MRTVRATRYVTPLREGGSLPGIVEADDLGTYVVKLRGAGQGLRVLVAEVVVAGVAGLLDVPVPELVALELPRDIARYEADEEVQDLLTASVGTSEAIGTGSNGWPEKHTGAGAAPFVPQVAVRRSRSATGRSMACATRLRMP